MGEFLDHVFHFPTMLFTAALVVVICFWVLVLVGAVGHDSFDADMDTDALSLGGVPVSVSVSLVIALAWTMSLSGSVLLAETGTAQGSHRLLAVVLVPASLFCAWRLTRLLVRPLARLFPDEPGPSRIDFVGLTCTIRTRRVDEGFGQAEVTALDGSTALVQVRRSGLDVTAALALGSTGLLYAYDDAGEFFWVAPY
ncbi:hypothetical protein [Streptomyces albipurpureus]|uniref:DUF1449 family protein n=1 Tax=Streptomyces albipurpureus TaxID=2897419 RepID=A0ABT0ULL7_9ACTN|nr:hypothetical protein [Streptomyces sp. CWNU-1]MCM2389000.1 hypothetical protein [Streptomyces sp. CWNU-1]